MINPCRAPFSIHADETKDMNPIEYGIYVMLMDACFIREEFPTLKEAREWLVIQAPEEHEALETILNNYFVKKNGVYIHERIKNYLEYRKYANNKTTN